MKLIFLFALIFISVKEVCCQVLIDSDPITFRISGTTSLRVFEGATEIYEIQYDVNGNPSGLVFPQPIIVNGTVLNYTQNPRTQRNSITVKWNCLSSSGSITANESTTNSSESLIVPLISYDAPNFCKNIYPAIQFIESDGILPDFLSITDSRYCENSYNFTYQWQQVIDISNPTVFINLNGENSKFFQPPSLSLGTTVEKKGYRRITNYTVNSTQFTVNSEMAVVNYTLPLQPGSIVGPNYAYIGSSVGITQLPAQNGPCDVANYIYTWETSTDGINFQSIGNDETFPVNFILNASIYIRRKIQCINRVLYTNVIYITAHNLLSPGSLTSSAEPTIEFTSENPSTSITAYNIAFNSLPLIDNVPATGGLCEVSDYVYTWQKKRNVPFAEWETFGIGVNYPVNVLIAANCFIRRKVVCNGEALYSNELYIKVGPYIAPPSENLNYVRANIIAIPGVTTLAEAQVLPIGSKVQTTDYLDGLSRKRQTVVKQGSFKQSPGLDPNDPNNYRDLVSHYQYDMLGRMDKFFLPFATDASPGLFKTNAPVEQKDFNNQKYGEPVNNIYTYSQTVYDGSPINRAVNSKTPGSFRNNNIAYNGISNDYSLCKVIENVRIWNIGFNTNDIPISNSSDIYPDLTLVKNITKDEKNKMIVEYVDFLGNTILKKVQELEVGAGLDLNGYAGWVCTYYVYDDFNRLRYTITPKAVTQMAAASTWIITNDMRDGLCFYQEYDKKGRVIVSHSPDGGEVWSVYDNRNRQVFTQDEKQRNRITDAPSKPNQWSFLLYDDQDRTIASGLIDDTRNRTSLQNFVDGLSPANKPVSLYTGVWEVVNAYNPVAGKISNGSGFYCQTCTESITNSISYYDEYNSYSRPYKTLQKKNIPPSNNNFVEPSVKSSRTLGAIIGSKLRLLDDKYDNGIITDDRFLASTNYMDEKGRILQTHEENIKTGTDVVSFQYDFAGKMLSTSAIHDAPGTQFSGIITSTINEYDIFGRQIKVLKLYTDQTSKFLNYNAYKKLSEVTYDEFGRAKTKKIGADPTNTNSPLEIQDYSYDIQGSLTGINKDYAGASTAPQQFYKHFGMYIGYENADGLFADAQWNGIATGVVWRSQGDDYVRRYNYEYDNLNRFKAARFTQKQTPNSTTWNSATVDLTATVDGYDENGNIKFLKHTGIVPGTTGGVIIDNLQYQYYTNSNKLKAVNDLAFSGNQLLNGNQGDFKDFTAANGIDYDYDKNGNLQYDKNKNIIDNASTTATPTKGIIYNFLDLPQQITIKDKSKTEYIYDASGNKLAKKVTQLIVNPPAPVTTYYVGDFVYEENELQFILNEEGRLRIMSPIAAWSGPSNQVNYLEIRENVIIKGTPNTTNPTLSTAKYGVWDYNIKDNLSNTRMVLTEEYHAQVMRCSMEDVNAVVKTEEEQTFGEQTATNHVAITRFSTLASHWPAGDNQTERVSKLLNSNGGTQAAIGPNALLKVMAGDNITAAAKYFYRHNGSSAGNQNILNNVVIGFINSISFGSSASGIIKDNATVLSNNNTGQGSPITGFLNGQPTPSETTTPKAYLNIIFFDEQFRYVPANSNAIPVEEVNANTDKIGTLVMPASTVLKNGYVYIYLSNESTITPVYFDDFTVRHDRAAIVEDNAYYPYGLKIAGISAKAALKPKAKYGYQGDYCEEDQESGYDEFALRNYDPQIGRWIQVDPYDEFASGYVGMGNNPPNTVDKDGGSIGIIGSIIGTIAGRVAAEYIIKNNPQFSETAKTVTRIGASLLGAGIGYSIGESLGLRAGARGTSARDYDSNGGGPYKGNGYNQSANVWDNFKQFYVGISGFTSHQKKLNFNQWGPSQQASTPNIDLLFWRENNLPDWDFWRMKGNTEPNISSAGDIWRTLATSPITSGTVGYIASGVVWGEKFFYPVFKIPTIGWYLYWLIHKPKQKGLSPYGRGAKIKGIF